MDSPQYLNVTFGMIMTYTCFKPYYKWIVLNTLDNIALTAEESAEF